jgi:cytochrome P450
MHANHGNSVAGSDSSALAIRATLLFIVTNPRIQSKLLQEISNASISSPITDAEARNRPYLQAVIKEGLRMYPPIPGLMLKEVPTGGDTLNGIFVPEKTFIGWSAFGLMRNEKIWGKDANLFRPERWLEGPTEEIKRNEGIVDLVFGYGKYQCLGKNVVHMELNKTFVEVCSFRTLQVHEHVYSDLTLISESSSSATLNSPSWIRQSHGSLSWQDFSFRAICGWWLQSASQQSDFHWRIL